MKSSMKTIAMLAVAICGWTITASAQNPFDVVRDLQRVRQQFNSRTVMPMPQRPSHTLPHRGYYPLPYPPRPTSPNRPRYFPTYPQYPVHVTPDRFKGINPYTGGIDTTNEQVDNSYYDRFRESSKNNGTRRWVRRPIYDANGNVSGYQEGYVWTNSITGVEHGELKNVTANDKGGVHENIQVKSVGR